MDLQHRIEQPDWNEISSRLNDNGYALISNILTTAECDNLVQGYDNNGLYRKTISMERYRFGQGEYKYFTYPLPNIIQNVRQSMYPYLAPVANNWMKVLNIDKNFPDNLDELLEQCHTHQQTRPTPLILKYGKGC